MKVLTHRALKRFCACFLAFATFLGVGKMDWSDVKSVRAEETPTQPNNAIATVAETATENGVATIAEWQYAGTGTFTQVTGTLESAYYVFGVSESAESINAVNNTVKEKWIRYTQTASTSGTITDPDKSIVWYYDAEAGSFQNGTNYVNWPTTGNSATVADTATPVTVTETATAGVYNITVKATPARILRCNTTNSGYRFYAGTTGTDTFYFFKLKSCEHTYDWVETTAATCGAVGEKVGTCSACGDVVTEALPATGLHDYEVAITNPTCTEAGKEVSTCSVCGDVVTEEIPATGHIDENPVDSKCDTCEASLCTEHVWVNYGEAIAPTCTETGLQAQICEKCGEPGEDVVLEATGHTVVVDEAKAATCTETGLTEGSHCSVCSEVLTAQETVAATGHNYVDGVCSACNEKEPAILTFNRDNFTATSKYDWHAWTATNEVGDTVTGYGFLYGTTTSSIQMNGSKDGDYIYNTTALPGKLVSVKLTQASGTSRNFDVLTSETPFNHETAASLKRSATDAKKKISTEGVTWTFKTEHKYFAIVICDSSAAYLSSIEIAYEPCAHSYTVETTEPTCAVDGKKVSTCSVCNKVVEEVIPATGEHSYTVETTEPTCAVAGKKVSTCSVCGDEVTEEIPATGLHDYEVAITNPTCTEAGKKVSTCSVCGDEVTEEIPATGHNFDENTHVCTNEGCGVMDHECDFTGAPDTTAATCTEDGKNVWTCPTCGATKEEVISATGHTAGEFEAKTAATCTEAGENVQKCTVCEEVLATETVEATGHNYEETSREEATCTENGKVVTTCANCGDEQTTTLWYTGHDYTIAVSSSESTCSKKGEIVTECASCGDQKTEYLPLKAHTFDGVVCTVCNAEKDIFVKVTEAPTDWSGTYIIVYEAGNVVFDSLLSDLDVSNNNQPIVMKDGKIIADGLMQFTVAMIMDENGNPTNTYTIQSASGYYIGCDSDTNTLLSNQSKTYKNTFSMNDDGSVNIIGEGGAYLRYNATSNQQRFRYYKSTSYGSQKPIALYKLLTVTNAEGEQVEVEGAAPFMSVQTQASVKVVYESDSAVSNTKLRFGTVMSKDLFDKLDAQGAIFGVEVQSGEKIKSFICNTPVQGTLDGVASDEGEYYHFSLVLGGIDGNRADEFIGKAFFEVGGVRFYMAETATSVENLVTELLESVEMNDEIRAALNAAIAK